MNVLPNIPVVKLQGKAGSHSLVVASHDRVALYDPAQSSLAQHLKPSSC